MAEEHVVVPRDRYKRLMDQLTLKHTPDESYQEPHQSHVETPSEDQETDNKHAEKISSFDRPIDSNYKTDESFELPGDADDTDTDLVTTDGPPGVTPDKVNQLVKKSKQKHKKTTEITSVRQKLHKKARRLGKVAKVRNTAVKRSVKIKGSNKNFANIKKNWLKAK